MDTDRYIEINGKTYFQLACTSTPLDSTKVYGIKAKADRSQVVDLVEVESAADALEPDETTIIANDGKLSATDARLGDLLALLVTKNVITQEEADAILPAGE